MKSIKQRRVLVANKYRACGYGRGVNTRPVYLIDRKYYAYHPRVANTSFVPLKGEFAGYVPVNQSKLGDTVLYYQVGFPTEHEEVIV